MKIFWLGLILFISIRPVLGKDFGFHGKSYEIAEQDALKAITNKLRVMKESGELDEKMLAWREQTVNRLKNPKAALAEPAKATKDKIRYFDPSLVLERDIFDHQGKIIATRGTRINPLERLPFFNEVLVFIDGNDQVQTSFALDLLKEDQYRTKSILVKGDVFGLMEKFEQRLYFDQGGLLVEHFGILAVPTIISKSGNLLQIREVAL